MAKRSVKKSAGGKKRSTKKTFVIGPHARVDGDVLLGYTYHGWSTPLRIGSHASIRSGSVIYAGSTIGDHFTCGHHVLVRAEVEIGDRCVLLHKVTVEGRVRIGYAVKVMAHVYIPSRTVIGDFVFIGPGVTLLNHKLPMRSTSPVCGATIGNRVAIGGGCTICPGVAIGDNSFIGAGSVVTKDVPPDTLAYGVPARHYPLPEQLAGGNWPDLCATGADLWGSPSAVSWKDDPHWQTDGVEAP